jgi:hypothetical protein
METDAIKIASGGKWGYIGLHPKGKMEIPVDNGRGRCNYSVSHYLSSFCVLWDHLCPAEYSSCELSGYLNITMQGVLD